jgi:Zn-dependent protease
MFEYSSVRRFTNSRREIRDFLIALIVLLIVGLSWFHFAFSPIIFIALIVGVIPAFLFHELAHKLMAQRHGAWAEFRIDHFGILITAISIIAPFKIIAPGAVVIWSPYLDRSTVGKISLSGPLTNIVLALIFLALSPFLPGYIARFTIYFNALVAFFNLLPIGIFDGRKIIRWSLPAWIAAFAVSIGLLVVSIF